MKNKKEKVKFGWHVLPESGKIGIGWNEDRRKPKVGQWVRYRGANNQPTTLPPIVCCRGMHAWTTLKRALVTVRKQVHLKERCWLCKVVVRGSIDYGTWDFPANKFAGEERKIIWKILLTRNEAEICYDLSKGKDGTRRANREIHRLKRKQAK